MKTILSYAAFFVAIAFVAAPLLLVTHGLERFGYGDYLTGGLAVLLGFSAFLIAMWIVIVPMSKVLK